MPVSRFWTRSILEDVDDYIARGQAEMLSDIAYRVKHVDRKGNSTGRHIYYLLSDTVMAFVIDAVSVKGYRSIFLADMPMLILRASLSTDSSYRVPGMATIVCRRPEVVLVYVPKGCEQQVVSTAGIRQYGISAVIRADRFLETFGLSGVDVPESLLPMLTGASTIGRLVTLPLNARLVALIESACEPMADIKLQQMVIWAKLQELVALTLDAARQNPTFAGPASLRERDIRLGYKARELLNQHYASPPPLPSLARQIGSNQNKLKVVFKKIFGTTMADYCKERRVRAAQALLLEGRLTIGQIAEKVGYEHQSSFTAAFRSQTGMSPREYQQHRPTLDVSMRPAEPRKRLLVRSS